MTDSSANLAVKRGSIFRLQLHGLLKPRDSQPARSFARPSRTLLDPSGLTQRRATRATALRHDQSPFVNGRKASSIAPASSIPVHAWAWVQGWLDRQSRVMLAVLSAAVVLAI